jgi:hypothetical protein
LRDVWLLGCRHMSHESKCQAGSAGPQTLINWFRGEIANLRSAAVVAKLSTTIVIFHASVVFKGLTIATRQHD